MKTNEKAKKSITAILVAAMILMMVVFTISTTMANTPDDSGCADCTGTGVAVDATSAGDTTTAYPIMHPDAETIDRWIESYNAAPVATIEESALGARVTASGGSHSLLGLVPYVPDERHQHSCGNCWVWAGTGCMEVAHAIWNDVDDRLSIQFFNSAYGEGDGEDYACCGGWLGDFAAAYSGGFAVPWDNFNANWQDGNTKCGGSTNVPAASISTTPRYNINEIKAYAVDTHEVGQATAIASIKDLIDRGHPVYFSFYLPDSAAWSAFMDFWYNQPDTAVWSNFYCGQEYNHDEGEGGAHAVLCVGYDDTDPQNPYWIMLNSWGAPELRPHGTFRVAMNIDYGCELDDLSGRFDDYSLSWLILSMTFANSAPKADANGPYTADEGTAITFDASGSTDPDGDALEYAWDFDNDGKWDTGWSPDPTVTHTWGDDYTGTVNLIVKEQATDEQLTDTDTASVTVTNVAPTVNAGPDQIVNEGDTVQFSGSFTDPGCDTWTYEWDFGDGHTDSGSLTPTHAYGDNGVYTVTLTVTDDDGGVGTDILTVTVNNVAPTVTIDSMDQPNPQFILPIVHTLTFNGSFADPGWLDTHTSTWDFGDGTVVPGTLTEENEEPDATGTTTAEHIYSEPGNYTVTLTVTDDDGGVGTDTMQVTVVDAEGAKHDINDYIQGLDGGDFKNNADKRKSALSNMFMAIDDMLDEEEYQSAIQDLRNNVRTKADGYIDGSSKNDWIIDPEAQEHICMKIDDLTAYLEYLKTL